MDYEKRAEELFREGYNCAQAVFLAFACEKMDRDEAARLASAFGGGLAGTRNTCGAVSGLAMAYGLLRGYADPTDKEAKRAEYEAVREMTEEFAQQNGSIICRELLGLGRDVNYVPPSDRSTEYYKNVPVQSSAPAPRASLRSISRRTRSGQNVHPKRNSLQRICTAARVDEGIGSYMVQWKNVRRGGGSAPSLHAKSIARCKIPT